MTSSATSHVTLDEGTQIDYVIDGRNRRIGKKVNGTVVQGFLYDDQLRPAVELDGTGAVVSRFVNGTHVNEPELVVKGGTTYRIVHDHLGSPRLVIDQGSGAIVQRLDYAEWGQITLDTNPGFQPFGFAGGLYDSQTKLVRFGARDHDPQVGRWTAKDPVVLLGRSPNLFTYAASDPANLVDPLGLVECWYNVRTGSLSCLSDDRQSVWWTCDTRSGNGACRNSTACERKPFRGPIPRGLYVMGPGTTTTHTPARVELTAAGELIAPRRSDQRRQFQVHPRGEQNWGCIDMPLADYQSFLAFYRRDNGGILWVGP